MAQLTLLVGKFSLQILEKLKPKKMDGLKQV